MIDLTGRHRDEYGLTLDKLSRRTEGGPWGFHPEKLRADRPETGTKRDLAACSGVEFAAGRPTRSAGSR